MLCLNLPCPGNQRIQQGVLNSFILLFAGKADLTGEIADKARIIIMPGCVERIMVSQIGDCERFVLFFRQKHVLLFKITVIQVMHMQRKAK
ncbi:hypothetical protein D3C76_1633600 [compost metagenome]